MQACEALASQLRTAAISENWGHVRDLLCDRAAALTVTEKTLRLSGVGKVVGKLRRSNNPAVAFAAEEVIEGWKFQVSLESKRIAATSTAVKNDSDADADSALAASTRSDDDGDGDAAGGGTRDVIGESTIGDTDIADSVLSDEDSGSEDLLGENFVALGVIDRCEILIKHIKKLALAGEWTKLLLLLQEKVAQLIVTKDALRRTGIGRVLSKVVRHAENDAVRAVAEDIIDEWKQAVNHRDPVEEREYQAEKLEQAKFQEFMSLAPAPLTPAAAAPRADAAADKDHRRGIRKPVFYEKNITVSRGSRKKPLGFEVKLTQPPSGGTAAHVESIDPDGVAAKAGREGCVLEVGDEIAAINNTSLCNCTVDETMQLLKNEMLQLRLRAVVPGSEVDVYEDLAEKSDKELYITNGLPLFHKVLPSDFITIA